MLYWLFVLFIIALILSWYTIHLASILSEQMWQGSNIPDPHIKILSFHFSQRHFMQLEPYHSKTMNVNLENVEKVQVMSVLYIFLQFDLFKKCLYRDKVVLLLKCWNDSLPLEFMNKLISIQINVVLVYFITAKYYSGNSYIIFAVGN